MADFAGAFLHGLALREDIRREQQRVTEVQQLRQQQQETQAAAFALNLLREGNVAAAQKIYDTTFAQKYGPAKITQDPSTKRQIITGAQGTFVIDLQSEQPKLIPLRVPGPEISQVSMPQGEQMAGAAPSPMQQEAGQTGQILMPTTRGGGAGGVADQIVRMQATDAQGNFDPALAEDIYKRIRTNPQGAESRSFDIMTRMASGQEVTAGEAATVNTLYPEFAKRIASQRAAGSEAGRLAVQATPQYQQTQTDIQAARQAGQPLPPGVQSQITQAQNVQQQIEVIKQNFSPDFLGPVKGTDIAFETRRRIGSYIGSPLGGQETQFRQALADVADTLLRLRSGAQINEKEYDRLRGLLPKATDEPRVFNAGLNRFEKEIGSVLESKQKLGVTPRGQMQQAPQSTQGARIPPPPPGFIIQGQ